MPGTVQSNRKQVFDLKKHSVLSRREMVQVTKQGQYCKFHERNSHKLPKSTQKVHLTRPGEERLPEAVTTEWRSTELAGVSQEESRNSNSKSILTKLAKEKDGMAKPQTSGSWIWPAQ